MPHPNKNVMQQASRAPSGLPNTLEEKRKEANRLVGSLTSAEISEGNMVDLLVYKEFENWIPTPGQADHIKALYNEEVRYLMLAVKLLTLDEKKLEEQLGITNFAAFVLPLRRQYTGMAGAKALAVVLKDQAAEFEKEAIFRNLTRGVVQEDFKRAGLGAPTPLTMFGLTDEDVGMQMPALI